MLYSLLALPLLILALGWHLSDRIASNALAVPQWFSPVWNWTADTAAKQLKAERITIPGSRPALYFPGMTGSTWLISLHGKGGSMSDNAYGIPWIASRTGIPSLAISYRNDPGTGPPERFYTYGGRAERRDLETAVLYAVRHGAEKIILAGNSYGGGIVASWLRDGDAFLTAKVSGVILDAPMLDVRQCIRQVGRSLPYVGRVITPLVILAEWIAALRFGVTWSSYLPDVSWLKVPALVFHGDKDTVVPVSTSIKLKELLPDLVVLERDPLLGHGGMAADKNHLPLTRAFLLANHTGGTEGHDDYQHAESRIR